jgi:hypothetical protein
MPCSTALICALAVTANVFSTVGQKGQVPGPLDSHSQTTLVLGASSRPTARLDLASIGDKAAQTFRLLVVYDINLFRAKGTHLATGYELLSPGTRGPLPPASLGTTSVVPGLCVCQSYLPMCT